MKISEILPKETPDESVFLSPAHVHKYRNGQKPDQREKRTRDDAHCCISYSISLMKRALYPKLLCWLI